MNQRYWGAVALVLTVGCNTAPPAVVQTSPAGDGAMTCAAGVLAERGYEVREGAGPEVTLEGEVRLDYSPVGATREIITLSVDGTPTPAELTATAGAWEYRAAEHSLPIARQSVTEVRPSDKLVADARMILETCGLERHASSTHGGA